MASVFKTRSKKTGKLHPYWRFRYRGSTGKWESGTGWTDRKQTLQHANKLEADARAIRKGEIAGPESWLKHRNKPITEVVKEYMAAGRMNGGRGGRPWEEQNAGLKERYLAWWIKELSLNVLSDIELGPVNKKLQELLKTLAPKSVSLRVEALRSLCLWALKFKLMRENPLHGLTALDTRPSADERHRALDEQEVARLLIFAPPERRLWYQVALETGYRVGELRALKVSDFDQFGPSLPLGADFTKNRKAAKQPITRELAEKLAVLVAGRGTGEPLLGIPTTTACRKIKADYEAADVDLLTDAGRATWHSLRKVFVNNLTRSGADLKTVMELARHSSASMSMDIYASAKPALLRAAAESAAGYIKNAVTAVIEQNRNQVIAVNESASDLPMKKDKFRMVPATGFEPLQANGHNLENSKTSTDVSGTSEGVPQNSEDITKTTPDTSLTQADINSASACRTDIENVVSSLRNVWPKLSIADQLAILRIINKGRSGT